MFWFAYCSFAVTETRAGLIKYYSEVGYHEISKCSNFPFVCSYTIGKCEVHKKAEGF